MIKTIKVKKRLNLHELIKYVWDNELNPETYKSNFNDFVYFDKVGKLNLIDARPMNQATTFTVEVEKEITKNTPFEWLVEVNKSGVYEEQRCSISAIENEDTIRIYALLDEDLELVWEAK